MLRRVALVRTGVSEELSASFIRVTTSVLTRATRRNIPEDTILHSHRRENLKSYLDVIVYNKNKYITLTLKHQFFIPSISMHYEGHSKVPEILRHNLVHYEFVQNGQCYCRLGDAVRRKLRDKWQRQWFLHRDNVPSHTHRLCSNSSPRKYIPVTT
jgi:hypothetical protein